MLFSILLVLLIGSYVELQAIGEAIPTISSLRRNELVITATAKIVIATEPPEKRRNVSHDIIKPTKPTYFGKRSKCKRRKQRFDKIRKVFQKRNKVLIHKQRSSIPDTKRMLPLNNPHPIDDVTRLSSHQYKLFKAASKQTIPPVVKKLPSVEQNRVKTNDFQNTVKSIFKAISGDQTQESSNKNNIAAAQQNDSSLDFDDDDSDNEDNGDDEDDVSPTDTTDESEEAFDASDNSPTDTPDVTNGAVADVDKTKNQSPDEDSEVYEDMDDDESDDTSPTEVPKEEGEKKSVDPNQPHPTASTEQKRQMKVATDIIKNTNQTLVDEEEKDFARLLKLEEDINAIAGSNDLSEKRSKVSATRNEN